MDVGVYFSQRAARFKGVVRDALEGVHDNVNVVVAGELLLPDEALDVVRVQYDAPKLVRHLKTKASTPAMWVVDADLFAPGRNFVFGQALANEAAVLSTSRLARDELVAREAVHEFGHLIGLRHCKNQCVMEYAGGIRDIEDKPNTFCQSCRNIVDTLLEERKSDTRL